MKLVRESLNEIPEYKINILLDIISYIKKYLDLTVVDFDIKDVRYDNGNLFLSLPNLSDSLSINELDQLNNILRDEYNETITLSYNKNINGLDIYIDDDTNNDNYKEEF